MTTVERLINLATAYADAAVRLDRQRQDAIHLGAIAPHDLAGKVACVTAVRKAEEAVEAARDALRIELRHTLERPVRAVPDERLLVAAWRHNHIEVRAIADNAARCVRVRYNPAQALAAGAALIACAAIADQRAGGTLSGILSTSPPAGPDTNSTSEPIEHRA
ncbi:hypothetical protein [Krasilnikovia sp. MM14-A1259]|uniref:hypothetical protein n=1 Tax=Krasilnikovia sp. MM14-A1259 TaxID=3373539 RepID=UPI003808E6A6